MSVKEGTIGDEKHEIRHFRNFFLSNFGLKAIGLISIPVLTRILTTEDYGILNVFGTYANLFAIVLSLYSHSAVTRYYFENNVTMGSFMTMVLLVALGLPLFIMCFAIYNIDFVSNFLNLPKNIVLFFPPVILLTNIQILQTKYFTASGASSYLRNFNLTQGYITFGILLIALFTLDNNKYLASPISRTVALVIFGGFALKKLIKLAEFKLLLKDLKYILRFSIPLIPAGLSAMILSQIDRVMLANMKSFSEAGIYSFAYNIAMLHTMILNSLMSAYTPSYYKAMEANDHNKMDKELILITKMLGTTAIGLILFGDILGIILADKSFHENLFVIPIILLGMFYYSISPFYKRGISFAKRTIYTSIIILGCGALNVGLNYIFIPKFGMVAAAFTTLATYLVQFVLTYLILRYVIRNYITSLRLLIMPMVLVPLSAGVYFIYPNVNVYGIIMRALTFVVLVSIMFDLRPGNLRGKLVEIIRSNS